MPRQGDEASCQRYAFWDEKAELVLVPSNTSDDSRNDKDDEDNDNAWLVVSLANFTGRLIVRPKQNNNKVGPEKLLVEVTPKRNNTERGKPEKLEAVYTNGNDQEIPSSPPRTKGDETMGFGVLVDSSSSPSPSLVLPVIAEKRPLRQEQEEEDALPVIAEKTSHDEEDLTGEAQGEGGGSSEQDNLPGETEEESEHAMGPQFPEEEITFDATNYDDSQHTGGEESVGDNGGGGVTNVTESEPKTMSRENSNPSLTENDDGEVSDSLDGSQRSESKRAVKQKRTYSLNLRRAGITRQNSPGGSGGSELFHRAVNIFKGEGKKRMPSAGDLSHSDSGGESDRITELKGPKASGSSKRHSRTASWGAILQVYSAKKHVPANIRQKRIEQRRSQFLGNQASSASLFPSRLHELCAEPDATLAELIECLDANKSAVFQTDQSGKLPLHLLGDNEGLVSTAQGKQVASAFAWKLMEANPDAITAIDADGFMPFVKLIADWIEFVYESHRNYRKAKQAASPGIFGRSNVNSNANNSEVVTESGIASNVFFAKKSYGSASTMRLFPKPEVWDEVEWCFSMLSLEMDELAGKSGVLFKTTKRNAFANIHPPDAAHQPKRKKPDLMRREIVCHLVSKLPDLLKTILLVETEGGETRKRILKMSIFRRMFLCKECIGEWLTEMLRKKGSASRRAVDFLEIISDTKISDYTGGYKATTVDDATQYHEERHELFEAINDLEGTIGSLVTLENRQAERAAATRVIWHIMGDRLARPFVMGLVLVDLILHISLMIAFRNNVQITESTIGEISTQSVLFICSHYLIRKGIEALALLTISPSVFRGYFADVWTLFDLMAIILTMAAFLWNTKHPGVYRNGFNAFVVGLLWMKVVSFLKVVNKDMSTFILALLEILQDIKYFLVVLVVVIFMFGDMFHLAVSTKEDGEFCEQDDLEGPTQDFCKRQLTSSYLRVYSMLLGDFELNDLQDTTGITTIYVIFTCIGVVVLLNVLIAVIADSYEKATVSSAMLFGRARVTFVAQNEALEAFLKPGVNPLKVFGGITTSRTVLSRVFTLFRWFILLAIIATACDTAVFLVFLSIDTLKAEGAGRDPSFVTAALLFVMFCILTASLGVLVGFAFEGLVHSYFPTPLSSVFDWMDHCAVSIVRWLAFRLFGLHTHKHQESTVSDDWTGRLMELEDYMEGMFERMIQDAKKDLISEMAALETRLYEHNLTAREIDEEGPGTKQGPPTFPTRRSLVRS